MTKENMQTAEAIVTATEKAESKGEGKGTTFAFTISKRKKTN